MQGWQCFIVVEQEMLAILLQALEKNKESFIFSISTSCFLPLIFLSLEKEFMLIV